MYKNEYLQLFFLTTTVPIIAFPELEEALLVRKNVSRIEDNDGERLGPTKTLSSSLSLLTSKLFPLLILSTQYIRENVNTYQCRIRPVQKFIDVHKYFLINPHKTMLITHHMGTLIFHFTIRCFLFDYKMFYLQFRQ